MPTNDIPDCDLLCGGFPCQDYSVATTLKHSSGIEGKKGVLWWQIYRILKEKGERRPKYLMLENVDRLLNSPAKQRGRDFAIILSSLYSLGYAVEWRIINASEYGMPQRRRRTYIVAYRNDTKLFEELALMEDKFEWLTDKGVMAKAFDCNPKDSKSMSFAVGDDIADVGTGAGFPGLVLAILNPDKHFTLIDSIAKKLSFVRTAMVSLNLNNISIINDRCENIKLDKKFDCILSRAFAPLCKIIEWCKDLISDEGVFLAMKANLEHDELDQIDKNTTIEEIIELKVPSLDAKRQAVVMRIKN